jgi:hypothetical protein
MELGELAAAAPMFLEDSPDKCPFCGKPLKGEPHTKDEVEKDTDPDKIKSEPRKLNCKDLSPKQIKGKYGRARHHIIPAIQCFKMVVRVARMALQVDYEINNKKNGIPLPTVWNPYKINGSSYKFGDLSEPQKNQICNTVMYELGAQWHVGNHAYSIDESETEDMNDEGEIDHQPYDVEVIKCLIRLGLEIEEAKFCENKKDKNAIKELLDELSDEIIRDKLNAFKAIPSNSAPFFVSAAALKYSRRTS